MSKSSQRSLWPAQGVTPTPLAPAPLPFCKQNILEAVWRDNILSVSFYAIALASFECQASVSFLPLCPCCPVQLQLLPEKSGCVGTGDVAESVQGWLCGCYDLGLSLWNKPVVDGPAWVKTPASHVWVCSPQPTEEAESSPQVCRSKCEPRFTTLTNTNNK